MQTVPLTAGFYYGNKRTVSGTGCTPHSVHHLTSRTLCRKLSRGEFSTPNFLVLSRFSSPFPAQTVPHSHTYTWGICFACSGVESHESLKDLGGGMGKYCHSVHLGSCNGVSPRVTGSAVCKYRYVRNRGLSFSPPHVCLWCQSSPYANQDRLGNSPLYLL